MINSESAEKLAKDALSLSRSLIVSNITHPLSIRCFFCVLLLLAVLCVDIAFISYAWEGVFTDGEKSAWRVGILTSQFVLIYVAFHELIGDIRPQSWQFFKKVTMVFIMVVILSAGSFSAFQMTEYGVSESLNETSSDSTNAIQNSGWSMGTPSENELESTATSEETSESLISGLGPYIGIAVFIGMTLVPFIFCVFAIALLKDLKRCSLELIKRYGQSKAFKVPAKKLLEALKEYTHLKAVQGAQHEDQCVTIATEIHHAYNNGISYFDRAIGWIKLNESNKERAREYAHDHGFGESFIEENLMDINVDVLKARLEDCKPSGEYSHIHDVVVSTLSNSNLDRRGHHEKE